MIKEADRYRNAARFLCSYRSVEICLRSGLLLDMGEFNHRGNTPLYALFSNEVTGENDFVHAEICRLLAVWKSEHGEKHLATSIGKPVPSTWRYWDSWGSRYVGYYNIPV